MDHLGARKSSTHGLELLVKCSIGMAQRVRANSPSTEYVLPSSATSCSLLFSLYPDFSKETTPHTGSAFFVGCMMVDMGTFGGIADNDACVD